MRPSRASTRNCTTHAYTSEVSEALNFPPGIQGQLKLKEDDGQTFIWDVARAKWLVLTPEEWVRQHCAAYLIALGYSKSWISTEAGLTTGFRKKRTDLVVYQREKPHLLVECKAPYVKLNGATFEQAQHYNETLKASFIWITNGRQHVYWDVAERRQVSSLPLPLP